MNNTTTQVAFRAGTKTGFGCDVQIHSEILTWLLLRYGIYCILEEQDI